MKKITLALLMVASGGVSAGEFTKPVTVNLLPNGMIELANDVIYTDDAGRKWRAPKGTIADGASIPRMFWSVIGGPLDGDYRNASIIHDVYCVSRSMPWREVHRVFYEAMLSSKVDPYKARVMYAAVYHFGPRWNISVPIKSKDIAAVRHELADKSELFGHSGQASEVKFTLPANSGMLGGLKDGSSKSILVSYSAQDAMDLDGTTLKKLLTTSDSVQLFATADPVSSASAEDLEKIKEYVKHDRSLDDIESMTFE
ncbi:DUF1353 domain-containing protein [Stenotrophomonas maltophilia]|nr:DUF1353 domain-containing protein [Stenotrophomonas maltophilia]